MSLNIISYIHEHGGKPSSVVPFSLFSASFSFRGMPVPHILSTELSTNSLRDVVLSMFNRVGFCWYFALIPGRHRSYPLSYHVFASNPCILYPSLFASIAVSLFMIAVADGSSSKSFDLVY